MGAKHFNEGQTRRLVGDSHGDKHCKCLDRLRNLVKSPKKVSIPRRADLSYFT
jgi:hypothetical protein